MNIIWGDRIGLRRFEEYLTDAQIARVYRWSCDTELLRWSGGTPTELTLGEFGDRMRRDRSYATSNRLAFLIVTRAGELIGRVGCFAIDWEHNEGELGIVIGETAYWGRGHGRDAILTMLRHLFETTSLERINLFTYTENVRAQRCFAACGFRTIGTARRFSPDVGEFDGVEMEITRQDFLMPTKMMASQIPVPQDNR